MNICLISREILGSKRAGGIATYLFDVSKALADRGNKVFIICAAEDGEKESYGLGLHDNIYLHRIKGVDYAIHSNRVIQFIGTRIRELLYFKTYRRRISKTIHNLHTDYGIDIVEFPEFGNEAEFWLKDKKRLTPTVVRFHGPNGHNRESNIIDVSTKKVRKELQTAFRADAISFCSNAMLDLIKSNKFSDNLFDTYRRPLNVIHNPIFINSRKLELISSEEFIFTAGTFTISKGFVDLIKAVKLINESGIKIKLVIAGKLNSLGLEYLEKSRNNPAYKDWLEILGPIKREELFNYYFNAKLNCFPSKFEPFGLTCIEAMSVNGLVLGSSNGGMNEIITDNVDGFLSPPNDYMVLKRKIQEIFNLSNEVRNDIKDNARKKIERNFSQETIIGKQLSFYSSVIEDFKCRAK